ncbi:hypothetical protein JCM30237_24430 [Halolamina litorea]
METKWRASTLGAIASAPAVVGDSVYLGSEDGKVYSVDREDGSIQWEFEAEGGVRAGIAVRQGQVYAGDNTGQLYALSTDGAELWSYASPDAALYHPITATNDYIAFLGTGGAGDFPHLHVLNHDGEEVYIAGPFGVADRDVTAFQPVSPAIGGDTVYVPASDGLIAIDVQEAEVVWSEGAYLTSSPALSERSLIGSSFGGISSASTSDGSTSWSYGISDDEVYFNESMSSAVIGRTVVTAASDRDNEVTYVYANDFVDGDLNWKARISANTNASVVADETYAYVADLSGTVHAYNIDTGAEAWTLDLETNVWGELAVADGVLYVPGADGYLYSIHNAPPNEPPTPAFKVSPASPVVGQTVEFDATASSDDEEISRFEWDFDGNGVADATGPTVQHEFESAGEFEVMLSVTNTDSSTQSVTKSVTVQKATPTSSRDTPTETGSERPPDSATDTSSATTQPPESSAQSQSLFGAERGLFFQGDGLLEGPISAWVLSAVGFIVSIVGVAYTVLKDN